MAPLRGYREVVLEELEERPETSSLCCLKRRGSSRAKSLSKVGSGSERSFISSFQSAWFASVFPPKFRSHGHCFWPQVKALEPHPLPSCIKPLVGAGSPSVFQPPFSSFSTNTHSHKLMHERVTHTHTHVQLQCTQWRNVQENGLFFLFDSKVLADGSPRGQLTKRLSRGLGGDLRSRLTATARAVNCCFCSSAVSVSVCGSHTSRTVSC